MLPGRLAPAAVPVSRIYILERGQSAAVHPVNMAEALPMLLRFSYIARFGRDALNGAAAGRHFHQAATLAGLGAVRRLEVPDGLDRLAAVPDLIAADVALEGCGA